MSNRRARWLVLSLLLGQFALLIPQVHKRIGASTRIERWATATLAPFALAVRGFDRGVEEVAARVVSRHELEAENQRLQGEVQKLRRRLIPLEASAEQTRRLAAAVHYADRQGTSITAADIVYSDPSSWLKTIIVHLPHGRVVVDQAVVASGGLVGRVILVTGDFAKVQLITDRAASAGVMIERTRRQGVAEGNGSDTLDLSYIPLSADVRVGDRVITAGNDGIYPSGLLVGMVKSVAPGGDLFHRVELTPAVDFSRLVQVYILAHKPVPATIKEAIPSASP